MPRWLYYLLTMAVVAPILSFIWGSQLTSAIFIFSILGLIPLAAIIGRATEDLEYYVGPTAGGLLNATFGNAPELIIGIFALRGGAVFLPVLKASVIGSVLSNSLLVLGSALACGGWRWGRQHFSARDAGQYSAMLLLVVASLLIPTTASLVIQDSGRLQSLSVAIAIVLLVVYTLYLLAHIFHVHSKRRKPKRRIRVEPFVPYSQDEDEGDKSRRSKAAAGAQPKQKLWLIITALLLATLGTAWNSELLISTIEPVTRLIGWSPVFVGLVIIPIVGNAAEHSSSVYIALRDRVDLSMAIAAGSSIQVATFVTPLLVIVSMFFPTHMNLVFSPLELVVLGIAALLFSIISLDGESSWLAGVQLIAVYVIACIVFFFIPG
jgi:Ca2+:H+ antiporter